jgi:hypothetical protein
LLLQICVAILKSGLVRLMIGQALALCAPDRRQGAIIIIVAERHAVIVPKIELSQIPMQVLFAAMLIHAAHPALED